MNPLAVPVARLVRARLNMPLEVERKLPVALRVWNIEELVERHVSVERHVPAERQSRINRVVKGCRPSVKVKVAAYLSEFQAEHS